MLRILLGRGGRTHSVHLHSRSLFGLAWPKKAAPISEAMDEVSLPPVESGTIHKEHFIPLTRRSVFRFIYQEKKLLVPEEREEFEQMAVFLDNVISRRYQEQLMDLKNFFDPINPDKDTKESRILTRRDRLDTEFFLLQRLADLVERANFRELSRKEVEAALEEHNTRLGVKVTVDLAQYDVLKFWVLGIEPPGEAATLFERVLAFFNRRSTDIEKDVMRYKRVLLAVRLKREDKLALKLFKDVPINGLEQLLPDGHLSMTNFDKLVVQTTLAVGVGGVALKAVAWWLDYHMQWSLVITAVAAAVAVRAWGTHKGRRQAYLSRLNQLLYWHNVANNRGLLTLIADRAQEEAFKETLLTFAFIHAAREPMHEMFRGPSENVPAVIEETLSKLSAPDETLILRDDVEDEITVKTACPGGLSRAVLEARVESWLRDRCEVSGVDFDASEAVRLLIRLGVVVDDGERLVVSAPSLRDLLARLPEEPRAEALMRPSPTEDEAFEGPRGRDVRHRAGWQ